MLRAREVLSIANRGIKKYKWMQKKIDLDGPQGWDHDAFTDVDRHMIRFKHNTAEPEIYDETSAPGIGMKTRTRICGNGWVVQRRTGVSTHIPKQKVAGGDEHFRHKQASHISNTHIHTIAHKISSPDYLRQRWTVSDPFKGYDDAAHFWYTPEHVPIRKERPTTRIQRHELNREKFQWPIRSYSGRRLGKSEKRSDMTMVDPGKPNPNHGKDTRAKFYKFCHKNNISYDDIC